MTRFFSILALIALPVLLAACHSVPDTPAITPEELPNIWKGSTVIAADGPQENWWKKFGSAELDNLLEQAVANNTDLQAAMARVEQSRARLRIESGSLFPSLGLDGSVSRSEGHNTSSSTSYNVRAPVSYELDLWQRNSSGRLAARQRLAAQQFDREALALVVASDTATRYFQAVALRERIRLMQDNLAAFRDVAAIIKARYDEGAATGLDLAQQNTAVANTEAGLAALEKQLAQTANALAVLTGMTPQQFDGLFTTPLESLSVPELAPVQPARLLQRRPDLRAQEANLAAARADLDVARTSLFPRMVLGVTPSLSSRSFSVSPDFTLNLLASVTQRIFEGGAIRGEIDLAKAQQQELVAQYRGTVLAAFQETEDALQEIRSALRREETLRRAMNEAETGYRIARQSYLDGATDFIPLLDAQRSLLQAQDNHAQAQMDRLVAATTLFKALGGGWYAQDQTATSP